jgi:hypothetical protein
VVWFFVAILIGYGANHSGIVSAFFPSLEPLIGPVLLLLVLVAFALPQTLILWFEPDVDS